MTTGRVTLRNVILAICRIPSTIQDRHLPKSSTDAFWLDVLLITNAVFLSTFTFIVSPGLMGLNKYLPPSIGTRETVTSFFEMFFTLARKTPFELLSSKTSDWLQYSWLKSIDKMVIANIE